MHVTLQLSLIADLCLSLTLVALWLARRSELHALLWGLSHLALAGATLSSGAFLLASPSELIPLSMALLCLTAALQLAGTRFFCGHPLNWKRDVSALLALYLLATALHEASVSIGRLLPMLALCVALCWSGVLMWRRAGRAYPALGALLALRGVNNLALGLPLLGLLSASPLLLIAFLAKTATQIGLIHAVIDELVGRFNATVEGLSHAVLIGDQDGYVQLANDRAARLFGLERGPELSGHHLTELMPELSLSRMRAWFERLTTPGMETPIVSEGTIDRPDGSRIPVELVGSLYPERGRLLAMLQIRDISERQRTERELERAANVDEVTGLPNRHALNDLLEARLEEARHNGEECSVSFIDLDRFKRINDTLGHRTGDELLRAVAGRLQVLAGPGRILARFGGDEFVIIESGARGSMPAAARSFAARVLSDFNEPFSLPSLSVVVTPSIGIACRPVHGEDAETLLRCADIATHAAKQAGRAQQKVFDDAMNQSSRDALLLDEALQHAIAREEFRLVYQPIVDAETRSLHKVEALLRWRSETLGEMPPDRFIPVAEENGLIVEIGCWVLHEACRQARAWVDEGLGPVCITINVSAWQLVDTNFPNLLREMIHRHQVEPSWLEIELTERVLIEEAATVGRVLAAVRRIGVRISLDDFGTGYSSLSYLTRFDLDTLKIDRSFITNIEQDARSAALVRTVIGMGLSLDMELVAEGVETEGQASLLRSLGCRYLQGYLISRPVPPDQILANWKEA